MPRQGGIVGTKASAMEVTLSNVQFLLALLFAMSGLSHGQCGGELAGPSGIITTPNYPERYPPSTRCEWIITVESNERINLTFTDFEMEDCFDKVAIYDGSDTSSAIMGEQYCLPPPGPFLSTSNTMVVVFQSDGSVGKRGFNATYTLVLSTTEATPTTQPSTQPTTRPTTRATTPSITPTIPPIMPGELLPFRNRVDLTNDAVKTICIPGRAPVGSNMFSNIHICENGYMSFDNPFCAPFATEIGSDFPYYAPKMIAPFWADIDTSIASSASNNIYVDSISDSSSEPQDQAILAHVNDEIRTYSNDTSFEASQVVLATWHEVLRWNLMRSGSRNESASFQAVYVTNGNQSFAMILYQDDAMLWRGGRALSGFKYGYIPYQMSLPMVNSTQNGLPYAFDKVPGNRASPGYWVKKLNSEPVNNPEWKWCSFYCCHVAATTPMLPTTQLMTGTTPHTQVTPTLPTTQTTSPPPDLGKSQNFTAPTGNFTTPNYPQRYGSNQERTWRITVSIGQIVGLFFHSFSLEGGGLSQTPTCAFDSVKIYDGPGNNSTTLLGTYCGFQELPELFSASNEMVVVFISDGSVHHKGFYASYRSATDMAIPRTHPPIDQGCGENFMTSTGTFMSPNYPQNYGDNQLCTWSISADLGNIITLQFTDFHLEALDCLYDAVKIYDGSTNSSSPISICGSITPPEINSSTNAMLVVFRSDLTETFKGFHATYSRAERLAGPKCDTVGVYVNEITYDGVDAGAFELVFNAGENLANWRNQYYSGTLAGPTFSLRSAHKVQDGIGYRRVSFSTFGPSTSMVMLGPNGATQFISFGEPVTAADGPAIGLTSVNIGLGNPIPTGFTLQLQGTGCTYSNFTWSDPLPSTWIAMNTGQLFLPFVPIA